MTALDDGVGKKGILEKLEKTFQEWVMTWTGEL